eukprot:gene13748-16247_t
MAMQPNKRGPDDYTSPLVGKHPRRTVNPYEEIAARVRKVAQDCLARAPPSAEPPHLRPQVLPCTPAHTAGLDLDAQLYKPISSPVATKFVETFVTSKEILLDSARRQRTIVPFTDHAASTEYLTRHVPLVCLTTISADDVKRMGLRERFPDEHGTTNKRPTPGQYTRMCLLLSFQNRDLVVRSHKLKDVNHNPKNVWPDPSKPVPGFSYSEDRLTATPTEISKTLHGCNTKNPFKVLVGSHFKKAEDEIPALCESWMPKHWAWTPETYDRRTLRERIELLEGNAQVMLLTTFGQSVIEQVIDDVSLKMPRGVRLIVRSLNNADPYGRRARPHAFDIVPFEPPANCHSVYDLTAPSPKLAFATTSTLDLNAALDPPTVIEYERCLRGDRYSQSALNQLKKKREQLNAYYGLQDHREPACPSPTKTGALVCTRCGSCVARESLTSSSWARLHYNSVTRTLRCPGCYYPGQLPSDLLFAEPDQPISVDEVDTYAAYNFPRALDGGGYANVFYITMAHHVLNRGSRRFVLFGDLPQAIHRALRAGDAFNERVVHIVKL